MKTPHECTGQWFDPQTLTNEAYHAMPGLSSSDLKIIAGHSPAHYQERKKKQSEPTAAMQRGTLVHTAALEPDSYAKHAKVSPKFNKSTKAGKEAYKAFQDSLKAGDYMVDPDLHEAVMGMAGSIRKACGDLFTGYSEYSGIINSKNEGVRVKIRPDHIAGNTIIDIKTTTDARPREFMWSVRKYMYHLSAAYYMDFAWPLGFDIDRFIWAAVESTPPYACALYQAGPGMIAQGRQMYEDAIRQYKTCELSGEWPGYEESIIPIDFPEA